MVTFRQLLGPHLDTRWIPPASVDQNSNYAAGIIAKPGMHPVATMKLLYILYNSLAKVTLIGDNQHSLPGRRRASQFTSFAFGRPADEKLEDWQGLRPYKCKDNEEVGIRAHTLARIATLGAGNTLRELVADHNRELRSRKGLTLPRLLLSLTLPKVERPWHGRLRINRPRTGTSSNLGLSSAWGPLSGFVTQDGPDY